MTARVATRVGRLERSLGAAPCPGCRLVRRVIVVNKGEPRPEPPRCAVCGRHPTGHVRVVVLDATPTLDTVP